MLHIFFTRRVDIFVDLFSSEMATRYGGDCTKSSLENRFRRIRTDASLINDAVKKGIDPITLDIGGPDGAVPIKGGAARGQSIFIHLSIALYILHINHQYFGFLFSNLRF